MARPFADDLRVRIAAADERGEGSCRVLAKRFGVSWEYVRKLRRQRLEHGKATRVPQSRFGPQRLVDEAAAAHMLGLIERQPDITIAELREGLQADKSIAISWTSARNCVLRLGLRLKKSRSMPPSKTLRPTASDAPSSTRPS